VIGIWFPDVVESALKFGGWDPGEEAEKVDSVMGVGSFFCSRVRTCG
jgi:hypothetical protein